MLHNHQDVNLSLEVVAAAAAASKPVAIARTVVQCNTMTEMHGCSNSHKRCETTTPLPKQPCSCLASTTTPSCPAPFQQWLRWQLSVVRIMSKQDGACSAPCSWLPYNNCNIAQWWWWSMHPFHLDQTSRNQRKVSSPKAADLCPLPAVRAVMSTSSSIVSMMLSSPMCTLSYTMLLCSPPIAPAAAFPCHCNVWPWWQLLQLAKEDVNSIFGGHFGSWAAPILNNHWMRHLKGARSKMQVS